MTEDAMAKLIALEETTWVAWTAALEAKRVSLASAEEEATYAAEEATWVAWRAAVETLKGALRDD